MYKQHIEKLVIWIWPNIGTNKLENYYLRRIEDFRLNKIQIWLDVYIYDVEIYVIEKCFLIWLSDLMKL